jgi:hypothetical protein
MDRLYIPHTHTVFAIRRKGLLIKIKQFHCHEFLQSKFKDESPVSAYTTLD